MVQSGPETRPFAQHRFLGRMNLQAGTPPSQFILYNHVTDYYYYGSGGRSFLPMRETLVTYLRDLGVEIITIYNTSEGLLFAEPSMERRYQEVTTGRRRRVGYGRRTRESSATPESSDASQTTPESSNPSGVPPRRPEQTTSQIIAGLGALLRQPNVEPVVHAAVIIERVQNMLSVNPIPEDRQLLDQLQSWATLTNGNVSLLIADLRNTEELPPALVGMHRSGVRLINVGLPNQTEINQLFISAEIGWLAREFGETTRSDTSRVRINTSQRQDLIARLNDCDAVTTRGYFKECVHQGISELNLRTLRQITTYSTDVWPALLEEGNLRQVEERLKRRVRGQDEAINKVVGKLRAVRHDLSYQIETGQVEEKLLAYFFFAGPTGVGKTEVFRVLAKAFPQIRTRKFNMPEYKEEHSVARFFGAPPGYVGHGRGELGEFLIDNPAAIVLFDEFEKAHPNVWKNFLTMLEGSLTTGDGVRVDLSQAIFIFTSNAGAAELVPIHPSMSPGEKETIRNQNRAHIRGALRQAGAPPELIGRLLQAITPFNHMTEPVIREISQMNLKRLTEQTGAHFHPSIEEFLVDEYARQGQLGARMIKQYIDGPLKADVLKFPAPRRLIYKTPDGLTRQATNASAITSYYQRSVDNKPSSPQRRTRVDISSDSAFRKSVSPTIAALLAFDAKEQYRGNGTGFFVSDTGYLVTARHVIAGCTRLVAVHEPGQIRTDMTIVGVSDYFDLALLKPAQPINGSVEFLTLANSGIVEVDTEVVTFGFPYLTYNALTEEINFTQPERSERGHIGVRLEAGQLFRLAGVGLNPGNSGGPLFSSDDGDLIGMVVAKRPHSEGMSFAIMSSVVQAFLREMGILQPFTRLERRE